MGSQIEEHHRRETAARERIESIRQQIAELTERLAAEENLLLRHEPASEPTSAPGWPWRPSG